MNNFYPTYKSKLKPWIKFWILKKVNGAGESTLKAVTISSGTLTKVDKSKALSIKEYYGNTVQNGTPSPEEPVEIQTITGDNTFTINSNSYRVDLGNIELCKIGNYQDRIYKENDKWYVKKNIGKVVLNGNESGFSTSSQTSGNYRMCIDIGTNILSGNANLTSPIYSDKFIGITRNQSYTEVQGIAPTDTGFNYKSLIIYCDATKNMTYAEFQTWLSTHNTTVYYVLAKPTTTEITNATLISQLNGLYEFYVQSSTVSISNNSQIPLEVLLEYYGR